MRRLDRGFRKETLVLVAVILVVVGIVFLNFWDKTHKPSLLTPELPLDCAKFLNVETLPDGTILQAGGKTTKSWRVRNCGTTTWVNYSLVRVFGEGGNAAERKQMLPASISLPTLKPDQIADIAVPISIPSTPGRYRLFVELANRGGYRFGDILWLDIIVK